MYKNQLTKAAQQKLKERKEETSVFKKAITRCSQWDDKDEFLDVIYWSRQIIGIIAGIIWGLIPLKGFIGIALFLAVNAGIMYLYFTNFQKIDDEEYGGSWELTKEGFMSSFAGFLLVAYIWTSLLSIQPVFSYEVLWIIVYTGVHHS